MGKRDYYVIQGVSNNPYTKELGSNCESYGIGANSYSYWVACNILGQWTELPLITPQQIKASREFKYIFSGDLERELEPLVPFPGLEKHLVYSL